MSSDRGRSPCDTGPLELRLEVIVPGTLAGRCVATRSTELVQRVGEQNVRSDGVAVPLVTRLIPVAYAGDYPGHPTMGTTCLTRRQRPSTVRRARPHQGGHRDETTSILDQRHSANGISHSSIQSGHVPVPRRGVDALVDRTVGTSRCPAVRPGDLRDGVGVAASPGPRDRRSSDTLNSHPDRCKEWRREAPVAVPNKPSNVARPAVRALRTADCELNPHGPSPVLTCGFMPLVGVQIGVGGPTPHRTTRSSRRLTGEATTPSLERWFVAP